jgi:son of sevenless
MAARPLNGNSRSDEASTSTLVEELNEAEDVNPESFFVRALYDFTASDNSSLSFRKDDIIEVLTQLPSGWWDGLLGEARGWFPSNYVEQIDDKEVYGSGVEEDAAGQMMDLQAEEDEEVDLAPFDEAGHAASTGLESALSLSTSTYPTDGNFTVGEKAVADFDALRKLMSTDGTGEVSSPGNNNAFQNLAEAAMLDQSGSSQRREGEERGKRSSLAMGGPDPRNADIELGSIFSKSTNPSLRDPSSSSIKSPIENSPIRERPHMKIGDQTAALGAGPSRPRAATGLPDSPTISYQLRERAASTGTPDERRNMGSKEDGDWVPRLTEGGEVSSRSV